MVGRRRVGGRRGRGVSNCRQKWNDEVDVTERKGGVGGRDSEDKDGNERSREGRPISTYGGDVENNN